MTLIAWSVAVVACAVAAFVLLRGRRAPEVAPRSRSRTVADLRPTDVAFDRLPITAMRVADEGLIVATERAREEFPFLRPGVSLLHAFGEADLARRVSASLETGEAAAFEARLFVDGRRTYQVSIEPYAVDGGREAVVSLLDVTEAIAYQELRMQFVANVSHELRTPLTGIGGMLEALEDPALDDDLRQRFAGRAHREVLRLGSLVEDILMLSELESGRDRRGAEPSNLAAAATAAVASLSAAAEEANVALDLDLDLADDAWVGLSDAMSSQLVANLVGNAIRYAGAGSHARVRVTTGPDSVTLEVRDDGAGIAEQDLLHIFERFYRADPARSKAAGGTGLGLSIVKHMVEGHGGEVDAESREGFGTTIRARLPPVASPDGSSKPVVASEG